MRSCPVLSQYNVPDAQRDAELLAELRDLPVEDVRAFTSPDPVFRGVRFSPDGSSLAVVFEDRLVRLFAVDALSGAKLDTARRPPLTPSPPIDLAWCPFMESLEGPVILAAAKGAPLQLHDVDDGTVRAAYVTRNAMDQVEYPSACGWSPSGDRVVGGYTLGTVVSYDVTRPGSAGSTRFLTRQTESNQAGVTSFAFSSTATGGGPANRLVVAGNRLGFAEVIDTRMYQPCAVIHSPLLGGGAVTQLEFDQANPFQLLAATRGPKAQGIVEIDLRYVQAAAAVYERPPTNTNQPIGFALVPPSLRARFGRLLAASPEGSVLSFSDSSVGTPQRGTAALRVHHSESFVAHGEGNDPSPLPTVGVSICCRGDRGLLAVSSGAWPKGPRHRFSKGSSDDDDDVRVTKVEHRSHVRVLGLG